MSRICCVKLETSFAGTCGGSCLSGRSAAWLARLVRDQEVEGSNPFAPTILISRSHIDLKLNCFDLFRVKNLSKFVNHSSL